MTPSAPRLLLLTCAAFAGALRVGAAPPPAVTLPPPTFRLSFEQALDPEVCRPGTTALVQGPVRMVDGEHGSGLLVAPGTRASFPTAGHLSPKAGTIALWAQLAPPTAQRPRWPRLFDCSAPPGPAAVALRLLHTANPTVPLSAEARVGEANLMPWPMGDARAIGDTWQHVALTWGPGGVAFFVNGVTLCADARPTNFGPLGERFYIGSEATGEQSAAVPIDDVCLFDRALDSQELTLLAGRQPGTDLSADNWLVNSSFEVGLQPWQSEFMGDRGPAERGGGPLVGGTTAEPVEGVSHSGQCSYLLDRSANTDPWWSAAWLLGPWLHLARGREATLSAWLRADRPGCEVSLQVQAGAETRAIRGGPEGGVLSKSVQVDNLWRRYSFTLALPLAYHDGYRARICVTTHPCRVWIDDVQFAAGPSQPYAPRSNVEVGLLPGHGGVLQQPGDWLSPQLRVYAAAAPDKPVSVSYGYRKPYPWRGFVQGEQAFVEPQPGVPVTVRLKTWRLDTSGIWTVEAANYGQSEAHLSIAVTRLRDYDAAPPDSPFGVHGGEVPDMRLLGVAGRRDVSGFLWKWLERSPGQWQDSGRFAEAAAAAAAGISLCGTLGDAPGWAAKANEVPDDLAAWARHVRRVMAANPGVSLWEVWNEPDLNPTLARSPERYVALLRTARAVQLQVAPNAQLAAVCPSSLEDHSFAFADRVFAQGALGLCDRVSWHPYCHDAPEGPFVAGLERIRALMARYGEPKPLVLTEYGTGGRPDPSLYIPWTADAWRRYDADEQAGLLVRQSVLALAHGVSKLYWYKWSEERLQTGPDTFGLIRADSYRTPKPALLALAQMTRRIETATGPPLSLSPRLGAYGYEFSTPRGPVRCYWDPNGPSRYTWGNRAVVYDLYGNLVPRREWALTPEPRWVLP